MIVSWSSFRALSLLSALFFFSACEALKTEPVQVPALQNSPVIDQAQIFSSNEIAAIHSRLQNYKDIVQIQLWTVNSLKGESLEGLSMRAAEKWKLGTKEQDNGVLILIAKKERKMRVEVGHGLEGRIPDIAAGRIVDYIMRPAFKRGAFRAGVLKAADAIYELSGGTIEATAKGNSYSRRGRRSSRRAANLADLFMTFIFLIIFFGGICPCCLPKRARRTARDTGFWYGSSGGFGGRGGFGGGFGGGGGWSGGGGSFGGGGASGGW